MARTSHPSPHHQRKRAKSKNMIGILHNPTTKQTVFVPCPCYCIESGLNLILI
ncbi:hypothetical protein CCACVL1_00903 [Corchorus capsularis]|uniref:Uncharacterized protein n=1 Tax=Corchorus capsularis TaxID=210143 RepID=A0A1R3K0F1_COCAP|nr:hypothetical protein CCACVL1_03328 [Corchorus capsularis]OMP07025.1 hypothetical protein CCACVL1_01393 [Corchorus capsularis]OMP10524.1 hypothetical protein CCACVL1_00903 [Corchorus capsularis]